MVLVKPPHLVLQYISVPRLTSNHIDDRLVRLFHAALLNPRLDLLISRELQHLRNLIWRANSGATDLDTASDEREGVDSWKITAIGSTAELLVLILHVCERHYELARVRKIGI